MTDLRWNDPLPFPQLLEGDQSRLLLELEQSSLFDIRQTINELAPLQSRAWEPPLVISDAFSFEPSPNAIPLRLASVRSSDHADPLWDLSEPEFLSGVAPLDDASLVRMNRLQLADMNAQRKASAGIASAGSDVGDSAAGIGARKTEDEFSHARVGASQAVPYMPDILEEAAPPLPPWVNPARPLDLQNLQTVPVGLALGRKGIRTAEPRSPTKAPSPASAPAAEAADKEAREQDESQAQPVDLSLEALGRNPVALLAATQPQGRPTGVTISSMLAPESPAPAPPAPTPAPASPAISPSPAPQASPSPAGSPSGAPPGLLPLPAAALEAAAPPSGPRHTRVEGFLAPLPPDAAKWDGDAWAEYLAKDMRFLGGAGPGLAEGEGEEAEGVEGAEGESPAESPALGLPAGSPLVGEVAPVAGAPTGAGVAEGALPGLEALDSLLAQQEGALGVSRLPAAGAPGGLAGSSPERVWAALDESPVADFAERVPNMAIEYPFDLDPFQKRAVMHMERGESVFVAAHTSAGKTVVAEYAIAMATRHMAKAIYTSPIKTLSNQKYRDFKKTFGDVGLMTGDITLGIDASCLIMTTEILRPAPARTKRRKIFVISTMRRPVPLEHYLYTGHKVPLTLPSRPIPVPALASCSHPRVPRLCRPAPSLLRPRLVAVWGVCEQDELYKVLDLNRTFLPQGYKAALLSTQQQGQRYSTVKSDWMPLLEALRRKSLLPVVAFVFSKRKCDEIALALMGAIDLTTAREKAEIGAFFDRSIDRVNGSGHAADAHRGIAVHHAGVLPLLREVVELLFSRGLLRVLFATETFAMGVNMPARCVVFNGYRKFNANEMRNLHPGEYTQMSGRAGRRGLDPVGTVIVAAFRGLPAEPELRTLLLGQSTRLSSQFRFSYGMILTLLRFSDIRSMLTSAPPLAPPSSPLQAERALAALPRTGCPVHREAAGAADADVPEAEQAMERYLDLALAALGHLRSLAEFACATLPPDPAAPCPVQPAAAPAPGPAPGPPGFGGALRVVARKDDGPDYGVLAKRKGAAPALLAAPAALEAYCVIRYGRPPNGSAFHRGRLCLLSSPTSPFMVAVILALKPATGPRAAPDPAADPAKSAPCFLHVLAAAEEGEGGEGAGAPWEGRDMADVPVGLVTAVLDAVLLLPATRTGQPTEFSKATVYEQLSRLAGCLPRPLAPIFWDASRPDPPPPAPHAPVMTLPPPHGALPWSSLAGLDTAAIGAFTVGPAAILSQTNSLALGLLAEMDALPCARCPGAGAQYLNCLRRRAIEERLDRIRYALSDQALMLAGELEEKTKARMPPVLERLGYVDREHVVQLKGRAACELATVEELFLTEVIFENLLSGLSGPETVAALSAMLCKDKVDSAQGRGGPQQQSGQRTQAPLGARLEEVAKQWKDLARKLGQVQMECGIATSPEAYCDDSLNFNLARVVLEWAQGKPFVEVCELTPIQEGSIVRCISRLNETLRDIRNVARVIGDTELFTKMEQCSKLICRDIVFAASLYIA
ncbi:putative DExH-box ATP-dependent RNA helicase DExH11 [Paratrimastix pyriformis]|uniref:DExH-box ATP-dependent RNA helicase DExH11 n=1 Tax=Paratrimastix pyriformis TaxID=342808 RepID=A0ABQ8UNQ2_9EUKA|nr:putative DExH-box ATP-dependent RNA helicase DExH11 [Paratrimastix pyriformis]